MRFPILPSLRTAILQSEKFQVRQAGRGKLSRLFLLLAENCLFLLWRSRLIEIEMLRSRGRDGQPPAFVYIRRLILDFVGMYMLHIHTYHVYTSVSTFKAAYQIPKIQRKLCGQTSNFRFTSPIRDKLSRDGILFQEHYLQLLTSHFEISPYPEKCHQTLSALFQEKQPLIQSKLF